jgi:hypothetical protein
MSIVPSLRPKSGVPIALIERVEEAMHIHGNTMNVHSANLYAANSEGAVAAQRAAEARKRLLREAQSMGAEATGEGAELSGRWLSPQSDRQQQPADGQDQYHPFSGRDSDFD